MSKYQHTLNLPKTDFPMRANLAKKEPEFLQYWQDIDLYANIRKRQFGKKTFILHDGPPYANGDIHIGHAVNKILKDIIVKSRSLSDYDAPYVPGWDCHGLPIELMVEKKTGKVGHKIDAHTFRKACRDYAHKQVAKQSTDFQRLGILGDWHNPYLTMDYKTEASIVRALGKIIQAGHFHKGAKPVHWCMDCASALAEAEVEYADKTSTAIDVSFRLSQQSIESLNKIQFIAKEDSPISIAIWTTTAWTLPANQAVCVHPDHQYVLVQSKIGTHSQRLLMAKDLCGSVMERYACENYQILASFTGAMLAGIKVQHPLYDREVPIILGKHVTLEAGTGAVHTAPGHGEDDYIVGQQYNLDIFTSVASNGCFIEDIEFFAGQHVFKAEAQIIQMLTAKNRLLCQQKIQHSYPHCWRHKTPILFRATPQWFISMDANGLREQALVAIKNVQWLPDWGSQRIHNMLRDRPDWCISRQRTWGVPITIFVAKKTGALHPQSSQFFEEIANYIEQNGVEAWLQLDPKTLLGDEADNYEKISDTLDVWFDSGVTHSSILQSQQGIKLPVDLYLEGSDQYRGWFQSSLLTSVAINGIAPYKKILTHGFTVDAQGKKMSKSKGNVIAPQTIMNSLGADVLRLWVAATDYRNEMHVSDEIINSISEIYRKIRNTARYLLANLHDFNPVSDSIPHQDMLELDQWAVEQAMILQDQIQVAYTNYQLHHIFQKLQQFCIVDMSGFYLDIIKDRMYTMQQNSRARRSAQMAMYHILSALVRWLAPILSFTAEEIWKHFPGEKSKSIFLENWYNDFPTQKMTREISDDWQQIIQLRNEVMKGVEKLRIAEKIGAALEAEVHLYCDEKNLAILKRIESELHFVFIVSSVTLHTESQADTDHSATAIVGIKMHILASKHAKCVRCWHHQADVNTHEKHPELCGRCIENIDGLGAPRSYA